MTTKQRIQILKQNLLDKKRMLKEGVATVKEEEEKTEDAEDG